MVLNNAKEFMAGHIIETQKQLYQFLNDIVEGNDPYEEERMQVLDLLYQYKDNHNCERIVKLSGMNL